LLHATRWGGCHGVTQGTLAAGRTARFPQYYERFHAAHAAFWRLNADLPGTLISRTRRTAQLRTFDRPVRTVFGAEDPYLNSHVARRFARLFPAAELELIDGARHYVQVDQPEAVATAILKADRTRLLGRPDDSRSTRAPRNRP
jgi:pimeloyl-ACP methyl ester carboxylesterase